jgi:hypothetical protein
VDLDAAAIDEQPVWRISRSGQSAEDPLPDPALRPANEPVVERLLRAIDIRAVCPTASAAKRMHDTTQHTSVIHTRHAAHIRWKQRLDPGPLRIGKPKEIRHFTASSPRH